MSNAHSLQLKLPHRAYIRVARASEESENWAMVAAMALHMRMPLSRQWSSLPDAVSNGVWLIPVV
jgi:hypothetical protein